MGDVRTNLNDLGEEDLCGPGEPLFGNRINFFARHYRSDSLGKIRRETFRNGEDINKWWERTKNMQITRDFRLHWGEKKEINNPITRESLVPDLDKAVFEIQASNMATTNEGKGIRDNTASLSEANGEPCVSEVSLTTSESSPTVQAPHIIPIELTQGDIELCLS